MKFKYFTEKNIQKKAKLFKKAIISFRAKHKNIKFIPEESALLVIDMQNYFLKKESHAYVPSATAIIQNIQLLVKFYYENAYPVVFTRYIDDPKNTIMSRWWKDSLPEHKPESEITPLLDTSKGLIIKKSFYDAFYKTELDKRLKARQVKQVVISGVMTHLCCETTARAAFQLGYDVFFTIDGTATYNQNFHKATLLNIAHGFGIPLTVSEIISFFPRALKNKLHCF